MTFGLVKHNNNSISAITSPGSLAQGKMTLIKEQTASSSSSISFVDGSSDVVLDSTYPIYLFKCINIHPSSTTFVKHFIANVNYSYDADYSLQYFLAGYGNTTSAVDAIQFKMNSGNIDSGTIKLYGVS